MSSKEEDERNEKTIRGLLKLPPNRKCINCNSLGPQYVCTNFWTFICVTCSGIHREFTHRVKSISMAKFNSQEVEALQRGGNQRAREIFLKDWDTERMRLPDSSNIDKLREFIKNVYVDKKYAGGRSSDKPPRDMQSPPYGDQCEERHNGKKTGRLTRKPGSDRGLYEGKISSFMYSPGSQCEQLYDRFANETSNSRNSDYSITSRGDSSGFDGQSPNLQDTDYSSPPLRQVRDILIEDTWPPVLNPYADANIKKGLNGFLCSQRTASSSSSFGSFDSSSASLTPSNSSSVIDLVLEPENSSTAKQPEISVSPSLMQTSASTHDRNQDPFGLPIIQQSIPSSVFTDMFAVSHQLSSIDPLEQKELAKPLSESVGWATFDLPHQANPASEPNKDPTSMVSRANIHPFPQNATQDLFLLLADHHNEITGSLDVSRSSETWDIFGFPDRKFPQTSYENLSHTSEPQVLVHNPPASGFPCASLEDQVVPFNDSSQKLSTDEFATLSAPFDGLDGSSFPSVLHLKGGITQEQKSTNPFDLPHDSDLDANNLFPDMSSLQAALLNPLLPTNLLGGLPQAWFSQNPVAAFVLPLPQGNIAYTAVQVPSSQLRAITSQGPVASIGGNPFA